MAKPALGTALKSSGLALDLDFATFFQEGSGDIEDLVNAVAGVGTNVTWNGTDPGMDPPTVGFNSSDSAFAVSDLSAWNDAAWTIEWLARINDMTGEKDFFARRRGQVANQIRALVGSSVEITLFDNQGGGGTSIVATSAISEDVVYHWHLVFYDNAGTATLELWRDGVLQNTGTNASFTFVDWGANADAFQIGGSATRELQGDMGFFLVYGKALNSTEIDERVNDHYSVFNLGAASVLGRGLLDSKLLRPRRLVGV